MNGVSLAVPESRRIKSLNEKNTVEHENSKETAHIVFKKITKNKTVLQRALLDLFDILISAALVVNLYTTD